MKLAGSQADKVSTTVGIVAAMVLATLVNVVVARHYKRWDVTTGGLYTLSAASRDTLARMPKPVRFVVLVPQSDPLGSALAQMLEAYRSEAPTMVQVDFVDPDRQPGEFAAVQRRYRMVSGTTDDGRVVADTAVVVARSDEERYFVPARDLVERDDADAGQGRHQLEIALTSALRHLDAGERPRVCFTTGHGERTIEQGGGQGLAALRDVLAKNNYEPVTVGQQEEGGAAAPQRSLEGCRVVVIPGPLAPFSAAEANALVKHVTAGGGVFVAASPVPNDDDKTYVRFGLGPLLDLAGVKQRDDFVFERDPAARQVTSSGEIFAAVAKVHPVTEGLVKARDQGQRVVISVAGSLELVADGGRASANPILVTSDRAFGMRDFFGWAKNPVQPEPKAGDTPGPLVIATATELAKTPDGKTPRVVVAGSVSVLFGANWTTEELRGTANFTQSAIAWLAARPVFLDIPKKPAFLASLSLSEDGLSSVMRYVVIYIPLAAVLVGVAVALRRRATERTSPGALEKPAPAPTRAKKKKKAAKRGSS